MFSLVSGLYSLYTTKITYNVLLIGLDGAGKTTFIETCKTLFSQRQQPSSAAAATQTTVERPSPAPTIGLNMCKFDLHGAQWTMWDLGGHVDLRSIWRDYFTDAHALLYMIDGNDRSRLEESRLALITAL